MFEELSVMEKKEWEFCVNQELELEFCGDAVEPDKRMAASDKAEINLSDLL